MYPDIPVIRTKIIVPRRRDEIISRQRLLEILDKVLDLKLLIVAAPAGYGKTSLLVDFSQYTQFPVCWYALDPLDCEPKRFIAHFISSLRSKFPAFGEVSLAALNDLNQDKINLEPVIAAIVNDAYEKITEHFVFVLDDYHLVRDSKQVETFINRIVQETAENCHFIIASRALLTLPDLSLLVARSQVEGLSFEELAFLPEEVKRLMANNYQKTISDETAAGMLTQTEGWITGLLLNAQTQARGGVVERSRIEKVSGIGIYEYLTQQVFDRQLVAMQSDLLRTSLLEEFDAALCHKVIDLPLGLEGQNWDAVLERIQRDNLFVLTVGEDIVYLRYHHLFRDFLQNRIRVEKPDEALKIEFALAEHYQNIQEWERAKAIYTRISTQAKIEELICKAAQSMILNGQLVTLTEWLDALPPGSAEHKADFLSIRGSIAMLRGEHSTSLTLLNQAIEALRESGPDDDLASALTRRSAINRHLGNYEQALKDAAEAILLNKPPFGSPPQYAEALRAEGLVYFQTGELNNAQWKLRESYRRFNELGLESDAAKVLTELGVVYRAQGDLEQTERCYADSLIYWQNTHNSIWQANVLNNMGVLQHFQGKYEQAVITLEKGLSYAHLAVNPRLEGYTLSSLGDLYRDLRAFTEASLAYQQVGQILKKTNDVVLDVYIILSQAALARLNGFFQDASRLIQLAAEKADATNSRFTRNICILEQNILELKIKPDPVQLVQLSVLEEYYIAAGYQMEAFKTSFYKALTTFLLSPRTGHELFEKLIRLNTQGVKHHALVLMSLEHKDFLVNAAHNLEDIPAVQGLLAEIRDFERQLPHLHRVIRRVSSSIRFTNPKLTIKAFNKAQTRLGSRWVTGKDWKTQLVRDLFYFILLHPEGVTKEEIGLAFWPDADRDTVRMRFKNALYRLRCAVGKDSVAYMDEYYIFNRAADYDYDVESFLNGLQLAEKAADDETRVIHLQEAVSAYRGAYLPKVDSDWALIAREKLHHSFMDASTRLIDLLMKNGQVDRAILLSERALEEDILNETIHRQAMLAHAALNDRPAIIRQYEKCRLAFMNELEIEPSPQTVKLYHSLIQ